MRDLKLSTHSLTRQSSPRIRGQAAWCCFLVVYAALFPAYAFPPAPHHTIFGMVRDELGNPLNLANGQVIFETSSGVKLHGKIVPGLHPGDNYQIKIPMDSGVTADSYKGTALKPTVDFRMSVQVGNVTYLPMEMKSDSSSLGKGGLKTRIDLTLGEDSDKDGLPDAWERMLIAELARGLTLADITPGSDLDGDGLSNRAEYIAGTYAHDPEDGFVLEMSGVGEAGPLLNFTALRNRTYRLEASNDFKTWTQVEFRVRGLDSAPNYRTSYTASSVRPVGVEAIVPAESKFQFFKLKVH